MCNYILLFSLNSGLLLKMFHLLKMRSLKVRFGRKNISKDVDQEEKLIIIELNLILEKRKRGKEKKLIRILISSEI